MNEGEYGGEEKCEVCDPNPFFVWLSGFPAKERLAPVQARVSPSTQNLMAGSYTMRDT